MTDTCVFKSKIDASMGGLLGVLVAAVVLIGAAMLIAAPAKTGLLAAILFLAAALVASTLARTDYRLTDTRLLIRNGPLIWRIPLSAISEATPIRSLLSAPALSMDRVRISYGGWRSVMISPADQEKFLAELEARRGALQDAKS